MARPAVSNRTAAGMVPISAEVDCPTTGPAFAIQGYASAVTGGCQPGRTVYTVNTLSDNPASPAVGSLRHACLQSGPRLIKFSVFGNIELLDELSIENGDLVINGIDAPNGGICIRAAAGVDWTSPERASLIYIAPTAPNTILRHLRIRHGANINSNADSLQIQCADVVVDHCSLTWGMDEVLNISGESPNHANRVTIQYCIIGEGFDSRLGNLINSDATDISIHHCYYVHNEERNPNVSSNGRIEIINTVTYNAGFVLGVTNQRGPGNSRIDFIKNYYRRGPNSGALKWITSGDAATFDSEIFLLGNRDEVDRPTGTEDENAIMNLNPSCPPGVGCWEVLSRRNPSPNVTEHDPLDLINPAHGDYLLDNVGALPQDATDQRLVNNFRDETGDWPDAEGDVGGYPDLTIPVAAGRLAGSARPAATARTKVS